MKKAILLTIVVIMFCGYGLALANDLAKLDQGGERILVIVRRIGYWIIIIKGISDLIKAGLNGDSKAIGKTIITCALLYGSLFFLPWALRLVEGIF